MTLETMFGRLGLPKHSAALFESLEKTGSSSATELARRTTRHRPAVYRALAALVREGFVIATRRGKRITYAAAPRSRITRAFGGISTDAVALERAAPESRDGNVLRIGKGKMVVHEVFEDVLKHSRRGETFMRYASERDLDAVNALLPADYRARRDAKRLERLVISNRASGTRKRPRLERFIRFLGGPSEPFDQNAIQLIYGTRVAFIDLEAYECFIIDNAAFARHQTVIFKALYRRLAS